MSQSSTWVPSPSDEPDKDERPSRTVARKGTGMKTLLRVVCSVVFSFALVLAGGPGTILDLWPGPDGAQAKGGGDGGGKGGDGGGRGGDSGGKGGDSGGKGGDS